MHKEEFFVNCSYVDSNRRLSIPAAFRLFEDAATSDTQNIGYGHEKTDAMGLLWVYSRVYARFEKMPAYMTKARIETRSVAKKAFIFPRYADIYDEEGNRVVALSSYWALIDSKTRKVVLHPPLEDVEESRPDEIPLPGKVERKPTTLVFKKLVTYSDTDLNRHMNNVSYVNILLDLKPGEFYLHNQISELLIQYTSEIHEGDEIEVMADEERTYACGIVNGTTCFEANISYTSLRDE